jgi:predicted CXXCH cytochrome family protein
VRSALVLLQLLAAPAMAGVIAGSPHDFSRDNWSAGQICLPCHIPHRADGASAPAVPLWNHATSTRVYTLYNSITLKALMLQPAPMSKLCLSCHDGTVALDSYGGVEGSRFVSRENNLGTDLNVHHPTSLLYDSQLAVLKQTLFNPDSRIVTIGTGAQTRTGTVTQVMLYDRRLECSSCHDVHNTFAASSVALMKITEQGSALCFACHSF